MTDHTPRVLLVDDYPPLLSMMRRFFERAGYDTDACPDTASAMELFRQRDGIYDIAVIDWAMTDTTGRELLERLRAGNPWLPVIVCSGWPLRGGNGPAEEDRLIRILQKPFDPRVMLQWAADLLKEAEALRGAS